MNHSTHLETEAHLIRYLVNRPPVRRLRVVLLLTLTAAWLTSAFPVNAQSYNTAYGENALDSVTSGFDSSAFGFNALTNDTSGYDNTAVGTDALQDNTTGKNNTGVGRGTLVFNQTGSYNTAVGSGALESNTVDNNTAIGNGALSSNTTGGYNTALGASTLVYNQVGSYNTANGVAALYSNTGTNNTANGASALYTNTSGGNNVASGVDALYFNTTGYYNTADGVFALYHNTVGHDNTGNGNSALFNNTSGNFNIALGNGAGYNLTTGSNNIAIGAAGAAGEAGKIRIGTKGKHNGTLIAGIYGVAVTGSQVVINSTGKLGVATSSARYKKAIKPMDKASEAILALEPVTFHYKEEIDPDGVPQFGLIAEQVEKVNPDLVVRDEDGKVSTVRYEAVNAMLLNEFLKDHQRMAEEHRKVGQQQATITELKSALAQQQKQIQALTATVQKVSDKLELTKPGLQLVANVPNNQ